MVSSSKCVTLSGLSLSLFLVALTISAVFSAETIKGPSSPSQWSSWINSITAQRTKDLTSIKYNASIFNVAGLDWTQSTFIQPQMHGYDAFFYDIDTHSYTYDKWLNDLNARYGGIDSFLFWVTYTNIGADDRNQWDMTLAVPGQMDALQNMITYFHQKYDIKILLPYMPWDQGTRDCGQADYVAMAQFLNESGADGFNGDTMGSVPQSFYTYSVDTFSHPIAIEPEGGGSLQSMNWDTLGWGYWAKPHAPLLDRWKWYDGRHMTNICNRWAEDHTADMQQAFFNGIGFESWENVWGCWNGMTPRDGEALRRWATIVRYFGNRYNKANAANFTQSLEWLPFIPIIVEQRYWNDVFASAFPVNTGSDRQQILFLIVNRANKDVIDMLLSFNNSWTIGAENVHVFDCYHGKELPFTSSNRQISVKIDIEGYGYGAILATYDTRNNNKDLDSFLTAINKMTQEPLNSFSSTWKYLPQKMVDIAPTKIYSSPPDENMVTIPMTLYDFENSGVEIEGGDPLVDVQYFWEMHPQKSHAATLTINEFYMDKYPVTCRDYKAYLDGSHYEPADSHNYLKNWDFDEAAESYMYPPGYDKKPVTYVSLNEARLFCAFNGKRLPHSYELQYSGQGNTKNAYPWGNTQGMGTYFPPSQHGRTLPGPSDVDAYPKGASVFNVSDLVGNVWQFTDEFTDIHTRSVVVYGSANYRPSGSQWYFPVAYQLKQHNKYFLMDDSYERCGTIGFRCAADAEQPDKGPNNWNGEGVYCKDLERGYGALCGRIGPQNGNNNLTEYGNLDWIQFGSNSKDKSGYGMIAKQSSTKYISINAGSVPVAIYDNNPNGFYWNDGESDRPIRSLEDAVMCGVFYDDIKQHLEFNVNNLKAGNVYRLRVYVGVWRDNGRIKVTLNTGSPSDSDSYSYTFSDNTVTNRDGTTNMAYDFIINLESVASDEIKLLIEWLLGNGSGNITLQGIALSLVPRL